MVQGLGFGVRFNGSGLRALDLGCGGLGFRVWCLGFGWGCMNMFLDPLLGV